MFSVYKNLNRPTNVNGGLADNILLAPVSWFDTIATADSSNVTINTASVIYNDHVFKPGKGWLQFQCAPIKNAIRLEPLGNAGASLFYQTLGIQLNGNYPQLHASISSFQSQPLIVLVKDCSGQHYVQLGNMNHFAWMSGSYSMGDGKGANNAYSINISSVGKYLMHYKGSIAMHPDIRLYNFRIVNGNDLIAIGSEEDLNQLDLQFVVTDDMILQVNGTIPTGYSFSLVDGDLIVNSPYYQ